MTAKIQTPRSSKGVRPQYFDDPNMDQMHAMILALATEVSVLFDHFDTIERMLDEKGVISREDVQAWLPDEESQQERRDARAALIRRLFRTVSESQERLESEL